MVSSWGCQTFDVAGISCSCKIIVEKSTTKLPVSFYLLIKYQKKIYTGFFKFGGEYKNEVVFFTKYKTININRVFSPPSESSLSLKVTENAKEKNYLVKKFPHYCKLYLGKKSGHPEVRLKDRTIK